MIIRKLSLLICSILCCMTLYGQEYSVHYINGTVSAQRGKEWYPLKKSDIIHESTNIKINPASSIKVFDSKSRMIYTLSSPGSHKLQSLILQNKKDNSSLTNKIYAETRQQSVMASQRTHKAIGAAKRATMDENTLEGFYASIVESFTSGTAKGKLSVSKHPSDDDSFILEMKNNSDDVLFVCIFVKTIDNTWSSLLPPGNESSTLCIHPGTSISLNDFSIFLKEGDILAGIGMTEDYDSEEILFMLNENYAPEAQPLNNLTISFLK